MQRLANCSYQTQALGGPCGQIVGVDSLRSPVEPEKLPIQDVVPKNMQFRAQPRFPISTLYKLGEKPGRTYIAKFRLWKTRNEGHTRALPVKENILVFCFFAHWSFSVIFFDDFWRKIASVRLVGLPRAEVRCAVEFEFWHFHGRRQRRTHPAS